MDDFSSMDEAMKILNFLMEKGFCEEKSVILVANKIDLVRNRVVSEEGKQVFDPIKKCLQCTALVYLNRHA